MGSISKIELVNDYSQIHTLSKDDISRFLSSIEMKSINKSWLEKLT